MFSQTILPPIVRLGDSTDVGFRPSMSYTTTDTPPIVIQPVVLRVPLPAESAVEPLPEQRKLDKRERRARRQRSDV